ncbi:putative oxalocrotonate tautomerase [Mycena polygramma]|nr:putative oxalocrotonate tautomerase [Mycena polygramma]KAJ7611952.1 putative oxalocrotonate tautomerase [Mycena polygramma]
MPLHRLFVPKGLYTLADKAALAKAITDVYPFLPQFYVVVLFIELEPTDFFVGGKTTERMVRISVEHIARNFSEYNDAHKRVFMDRYEAALAPFIKARGLDWEVQVTDCDRALWNMNGMAPPEIDTEEEKVWKRENRAVPPEEIEALQASGRL